MNETSTFESRTGIVTCGEIDLFKFLTDLRNFRRFIPADKFSDIKIDRESCTFVVSMMGKVDIRLGGAKEFSEVVYSGHAMQINEFSLEVRFRGVPDGMSEVKLSVIASLSPFLKMIASDPVKKFLATLIDQMEKFDGWKEITIDS